MSYTTYPGGETIPDLRPKGSRQCLYGLINVIQEPLARSGD